MSQARFIVGDVLEVLRSLPDDSVDLVLTSPPFLALRSYLPADHPQKDREFGSEPTPGAFIDALLDVVEECRRVLAPHGSLCIELGDTYAGSGGAGGDYNDGGLREGQPSFEGSARKYQRHPGRNAWEADHPISRVSGTRGAPGGRGWPQDKSLTLVPELFRIALAYGVNPLTGRTTEPWRIRNVIRWVRPNPPVGALGDKFRPATSEMVVACTSRTRYFDLDSVRSVNNPERMDEVDNPDKPSRHGADEHILSSSRGNGAQNPAGAPPLDWWAIPTEPYPGSHYATWPRDLLVRPIKAMCPERVCRVCGEPSRRVVEDNEQLAEAKRLVGDKWQSGGLEKGLKRPKGADRIDVPGHKVTLGWTDCKCSYEGKCQRCKVIVDPSGKRAAASCRCLPLPPDVPAKWRPGVVLDPFAGSGTTLAVATGHGRDAIGIDLDSSNVTLAEQRVGLFLTVEYFDGDADPAVSK